METIGTQEIWSLPDGATKAETKTCTQVRKGRGHKVESFLELATKVAELQFMNRDHVLLFWGQAEDHRNVRNNTTLKPTLFRPKSQGNPSPTVLIDRFDDVKRAEQRLARPSHQNQFIGVGRLERHQSLRWCLLDHYEVCPTPLLDVSHALRIAAS